MPSVVFDESAIKRAESSDFLGKTVADHINSENHLELTLDRLAKDLKIL